MGIIRYKDVPYGGGGSSVTPNPSGTATANLEKVQIESTVYAIKDSNAVHGSDKGTANGVASLDANGKVPSAQLPSYVDDVVEGYYDTVTDRFYEESTFTTVIPPEDGKSWVDVASNKSYRWTGSVYVRVDEGVQLGETSNTAYRGDRGKTAYDHATESGKISSAVASGLYKIAATAEGHIASLTAAVKADFTALGLADASLYLPLAGGEMTGRIDTYAPPSDIMPAIMPKTEFCGSVGFSDKPYRFGFFQGMVLGATYGTGGTSVAKMGTLTMYTGLGAYAAVIKPDPSQSASEVDLVLPKTSGTLALTSEIPTKTSDLTNDSGFVTTDEKVTGQTQNPSTGTVYNVPFIGTSNQKPYYNNGFKYDTREGTASVAGYGGLWLGNSTASGTAGNKRGEIGIYAETSKYVLLRATANMTSSRTITFPDKAGTIALTADLTTYAFAQGTNNGEIKITPSVGGTAGTAVTVKPKGISDLAYIAKGSGSSKFLREDGTWQTVTASWSGGQVTSNIYPNATGTLKVGTISRYFSESYVRTAYVNTCVVGYEGEVTGSLYLSRAEGYSAIITAPVLSANVALTLPSADGTLATQEWASTIDFTYTTSNGTANYFRNGKVVYVTLAGFTYLANYTVPSGYRPKEYYTYAVVFDVSGKRYVHIQFKTDGTVVVRNSNDTILTSYRLYGTICYLIP